MGRIVRETIGERFSKMLSYSIITSIVIALIGVVLLFMPRLSNKLIGVILGTLFLLYGITTIYKYITRNGAKLYSLNLVYGIIISLIGVIIILVPFSVTSFLTICLGLHLIVMGLNKITYGVWFKIGNHSSWLITLVIGIMLIIFGILVLANPFASLTITKLVGSFLILASILDITDLILLKNKSDEITKIFW
ncbi:MAG: DUF308 domain-containing protein [bacterium]|nr:DUF308 domain-containing protein [bacterium]